MLHNGYERLDPAIVKIARQQIAMGFGYRPDGETGYVYIDVPAWGTLRFWDAQAETAEYVPWSGF